MNAKFLGRRLAYFQGPATFYGILSGQHVLCEGRPGEGPDGTCAIDIVAVCTSFEAALAAARLLTRHEFGDIVI